MLLDQGAIVHCLYKHNENAAVALKARLGSVRAERLDLVRADVTEDAPLIDAFKHVASASGRLDILVHCAGAVSDGLLLRMSDDRVRAGLRLNLESAIACAREALPMMLRQRYGRIVHVSSVVAALGNAGQTVYAAAKGGVEAFTRSLAREVGTRGITVNCVAPGLIETEMTDSMREAVRARALGATALGRAGTAAEVASAVGYLCSEEAAYVTGAVLHVNGGMYM